MDLNIKNINFKSKIFIGIAAGTVIFAALLAIYYFMFFSPLETSLNQKKSSLSIVKTRYTSYLAEVRTYPALVKKQKGLEIEFLSLLTELPSKKNIPGLLMEVSNYAKALHLNLDMFKPGKVAPKSFYEAVPFSMSISGSFFNVYNFFYKLADMNRIVDVHNVSISGNTSKDNVAASFEGTTFSFIGVMPKLLTIGNINAGARKHGNENNKVNAKGKTIKNNNVSSMPGSGSATKMSGKGLKYEYKYKHIERKTANGNNDNNNSVVKNSKNNKNNKNKNVKNIKNINNVKKKSLAQKIELLKRKYLTVNPYPYNLTRNPFRTFLYTKKPNISFKYAELPLLQYSLSSLHIVGIMERNGKYYAMVSTPNGRSYIVTSGSIMGVNRARIMDITENSIVLSEKTYNQLGQMHTIDYVMSMK
jgi:type IV pilus assembly protein PilO